MKIITKKKQIDIAKRLAAIYYTAIHWRVEEWNDFAKCIVDNCTEIAYSVGGERMMTIEVSAFVKQLNRRLADKEEAE